MAVVLIFTGRLEGDENRMPEKTTAGKPSLEKGTAGKSGNSKPAPENARRVTAKIEGQPLSTWAGRVLVEDQDGFCLLQDTSGQIQVFETKTVEKIEDTNDLFRPQTLDKASEAMLRELPSGFKTMTTKHYVICYNTTDSYAKWNGGLYERLYTRFEKFWERQGVDLKEPEFPLVAVVFEDREGYLKYAEEQGVRGAENMIGFYNLLDNRIAAYDLTGIEGMIPPGKRVSSVELVNTILKEPAAERTVATIVHEAVHQIAYNTGLQKRLVDNPYAISEGLATFFESPDLTNATGLGNIGKINHYNLNIFRQSLKAGFQPDLLNLLQDDSMFRDGNTATFAYSFSWALNYFLIKTRAKEYAAYMKELAQGIPREASLPKKRIAVFQKHFGNDLDKLHKDFMKYISKL